MAFQREKKIQYCTYVSAKKSRNSDIIVLMKY